MTDDEINQKLVSSFDLWKAQVMRLIKDTGGTAKHVLNTLRLNGLTLAEILAIIRKEVKAHEDDDNNPHKDDLSKLGGMTKADFDKSVTNLFPKDAIPVTKVPLIKSTAGERTLSLPKTEIVFQGRQLTIPAKVLDLSTQPRQYVRVIISNPGSGETAAFAVSAGQVETLTSMIIGFVDLADGTYTPTLLETVRVGNATLRTTPRGQSIPVSTGTPAAPGSINSGWVG